MSGVDWNRHNKEAKSKEAKGEEDMERMGRIVIRVMIFVGLIWHVVVFGAGVLLGWLLP